MNALFLRAFALVIVLFFPNTTMATPGPVPQATPVMAGGWSVASIRDQTVVKAARASLARHPRHTIARNHRVAVRLRHIESAETQVVAGTNYRLILMLSDGTRWRTVVWQQLDGSLSVTEWTLLR